jgi:hypothetical protein
MQTQAHSPAAERLRNSPTPEQARQTGPTVEIPVCKVARTIPGGLSATRKLSRNGLVGRSTDHLPEPTSGPGITSGLPVIRSQSGMVCVAAQGHSKDPSHSHNPRECSLQNSIAGHSSILTRVTRIALLLASGPNISASPSAKPDANCGNAPVMFGR